MSWVFGPGGGTPGGADKDIQFNNNGEFSGSSLLTTDGSGSLSASTHVSASTYYGDGSNLTGVTASAVQVADGPEYSIQFRRDAPVSGEISGSANFSTNAATDKLFVTGAIHLSSSGDLNTTALIVTGTAGILGNLVVGNGSGGGYVSANGDLNTRLRFGISGSDSIALEAGGQPLFVIDNNGSDRIMLGTPSNYVTASISGNLLVCNGTASIAHLSGCSPITVHSPIQMQSGLSLSFNGDASPANTAKITNNGTNLDINSPGNIILNNNTILGTAASHVIHASGSLTASVGMRVSASTAIGDDIIVSQSRSNQGSREGS